VRCMLGLIGYYRSLIDNMAEHTHCWTELLKKSAPEKVIWTDEHQRALDYLNKMLTSKPVLTPADPQKNYILQADSSIHSLGAVLSQLSDDGQELVVAYASRKLLPRERNFSTIERELLAIIWSLQHWEHYVYGRKVTIFSDHKGLSWLATMANHNPRLQRWNLMLERYNVETVYKKGSLNANCDALSRLDCN